MSGRRRRPRGHRKKGGENHGRPRTLVAAQSSVSLAPSESSLARQQKNNGGRRRRRNNGNSNAHHRSNAAAARSIDPNLSGPPPAEKKEKKRKRPSRSERNKNPIDKNESNKTPRTDSTDSSDNVTFTFTVTFTDQGKVDAVTDSSVQPP